VALLIISESDVVGGVPAGSALLAMVFTNLLRSTRYQLSTQGVKKREKMFRKEKRQGKARQGKAQQEPVFMITKSME
jgi:hypothetical protein